MIIPRLFLLVICLFPSLLSAAETPWDLKKLSTPPSLQWLATDAPVHSLTYSGEPYHGRPTSVFAYYASPATLEKRTPTAEEKGKFPAIVLIHGGGGTAFKVWAELWARRGYAAIAMDLAGSRPDETDPKKRTRLPDGGPEQSHVEKFKTLNTEDLTDDWSYHAVANGILAHSLLLSLPEVDKTRTAVTGISWGGYTTCIVSSVDSRFKAAVPVYGCGFLNENSTWLKDFEGIGPDQTARWVKLYDPGSWLKQSQVPTFFVNGTNDFAYPLDSYMKSYNAVPAAKNIRIQVNMPHGHESGWAPQEIGLYVDHALHLRSAKPLPKIADLPTIKDNTITATVASVTPLTKAELHYALPGDPALPINKRVWTTVPAVISENQLLTAPAPPAGADLYFFTVTDDRKATISSPVVIR
ncbi:acylamino acid-releasing protein [Phragmitibacter flavus]|uniref:Acylamino acid-releasing protein n=1 Tax=Phragmitibacter flavus TaxID=2576071 RepID=A0A5R8KIN8_9BACT|nr:alpha/beta fold hydrolase [Phragmitibacter flavus]TLD71825.1 acylamino acid-releasing protein [Phragmitibacter flavus]